MMQRVILIVFSILMFVLAAQTRLSDKQMPTRLAHRDGVMIQTDDGIKTVFPIPGFAYPVGGDQAQLLPGCSNRIVLSDVPVRQPDGRYTLRFRPNPAVIAVYRNGLRLLPSKYNLIWLDQNQLPDRFEIPGSVDSDEIVVDYQIGASSTIP